MIFWGQKNRLSNPSEHSQNGVRRSYCRTQCSRAPLQAVTQESTLTWRVFVPGWPSFFQDRYFNGSFLDVQGCEGYAALFCGVVRPVPSADSCFVCTAHA